MPTHPEIMALIGLRSAQAVAELLDHRSMYRWEAIRNHAADSHLGEFVTEAMRNP